MPRKTLCYLFDGKNADMTEQKRAEAKASANKRRLDKKDSKPDDEGCVSLISDPAGSVPLEHNAGERLARFLAHAGVASRRHAEKLIAAGRVQVNGTTITAQGVRIHPEQDRVYVDGKLVQAHVQSVYVLLHKPAGYLCTVKDPHGRPTVLDLLPVELRRLHIYPVGRLDLDTSGLLLLTNDGDFALRLAHPRYEKEKYYEALVHGVPTAEALNQLRRGVTILEDDGRQYRTAPAQVRQIRRAGSDAWLALTIHEGHKRQVRRMLSIIGHRVVQLVRVQLGPLTLQGVPVGKWRYLTDAEVAALLQ
jgi:23S rRNA pseudouridine2605 synthase